jgi:hypothetical protein
MRLFITSLILFLALGANAQRQDAGYTWYKGNTHTHSYWSDGDDFPEMIMDWYKSHGYDFVCLSDHNTLAQGEKWKLIPAFPAHERRFFEYLEKYGDRWVTYTKDSVNRINVKLKTYDEYKPLFEEKDKFLIMPAEEISASYEKKPIHIGAINIKDAISPRVGNSVSDVMQKNLDAVYEQRRRTSQAMFAHINHPNFMWAVTLDDLLNLKGERFLEVYNGHPQVNNYGDSLRPGIEEMWDKLIVDCVDKNKPLIYGLATDDAHNYLSYSSRESNPGRGYIMVRAKALTDVAIIQAMEKGDFYSSTGVELEAVTFARSTLVIKVKPQPGVGYKIQFFGTKVDSSNAMLLLQVEGSEARYTLKKGDLYVRAKIVSTRYKANPFQEGDFETAWTQPVLNKKAAN